MMQPARFSCKAVVHSQIAESVERRMSHYRGQPAMLRNVDGQTRSRRGGLRTCLSLRYAPVTGTWKGSKFRLVVYRA
jgi:hypothetical protein